MIKESLIETQVTISNGLDKESETIYHYLQEGGVILSSLQDSECDGFRINDIISIIVDVSNEPLSLPNHQM